MVRSAKDLYRQALDLNDSERAELAALLLESLDPGTEQGTEAAWVAEIERRVFQLDSGMVSSVPWEAVRERLVRTLRGSDEP